MKYAVQCEGDCGLVPLSEEEYDRQMDHPNRTWICPRCGSFAWWDDKTLEANFSAEVQTSDLS